MPQFSPACRMPDLAFASASLLSQDHGQCTHDTDIDIDALSVSCCRSSCPGVPARPAIQPRTPNGCFEFSNGLSWLSQRCRTHLERCWDAIRAKVFENRSQYRQRCSVCFSTSLARSDCRDSSFRLCRASNDFPARLAGFVWQGQLYELFKVLVWPSIASFCVESESRSFHCWDQSCRPV